MKTENTVILLDVKRWKLCSCYLHQTLRKAQLCLLYRRQLLGQRVMLSRSIRSRSFCRVYSGLWFEGVISLWLTKHSHGSRRAGWSQCTHSPKAERNAHLHPPFYWPSSWDVFSLLINLHRKASWTCPEVSFQADCGSCQTEGPHKHPTAPGDLIMYKVVTI